MIDRPSTPNRSNSSTSGARKSIPTPLASSSRTPLGMQSINVKRERSPSLPSPSQIANPALRKAFKPPARIRSLVQVKAEPIESLGDAEDGNDIKPILNMDVNPLTPFNQKLDIKPNLDEIEGNKGQSPSLRSGGRVKRPRTDGTWYKPIVLDSDDEDMDAVHEPDHERPLRPGPQAMPHQDLAVADAAIGPLAPHPPFVHQPLPGLQPIAPAQDPDFVDQLIPDPADDPPPAYEARYKEPFPAVEPEPDVPALSRSQQRVLDAALEGRSVLIHGSAGTGKSVVIRAIKKAFEQRFNAYQAGGPGSTSTNTGEPILRQSMTAADRLANPLPQKPWKLAVTASTGLAAVNVGGSTIHSFVGGGNCDGDLEDHEYIDMIRKTAALDDWTSTAAVIIDEISMIDGRLFDRIDRTGQAIRGNSRPFGGLQIIACGDFLQLSPVGELNAAGQKDPICTFNSKVGPRLFPRPQDQFNLEQNYRQEDIPFGRLLERMRRGYLMKEDHDVLKGLGRELENDVVDAVHLSSRKKEVAMMNRRKLDLCPGPDQTYYAQDMPGINLDGQPLGRQEATRRLNQDTRLEEKLDLRIGAQVMLIMNMKERYLVNGTTGRVVGYMTRDEAQKEGISEPSLTDWFDPPRDVRYPVVAFANLRYCNESPPDRMLIAALSVDITGPRKVRIATRTQVPLILAWALTIHKAQGQTLDKVKVDIGGCFAAGQAYTAVSRVTHKDGLQLINFKPHKVDRDAKRWLMDLEGEDDYMSYVEQPED